MLNEQTLSTLNALKLFSMAHGFTERTSHPNSAELSHKEFLGLLVHDEMKTSGEATMTPEMLNQRKIAALGGSITHDLNMMKG
jgi:hypothetical protein